MKPHQVRIVALVVVAAMVLTVGATILGEIL